MEIELDQSSLDTDLGDTDYLIEAFGLGLGAPEVLEQGEPRVSNLVIPPPG